MSKLFLVSLCVLLLGSLLFATGTQETEEKAAQPPKKLVVVGHNVHRKVTTTGDGGDITADWMAESGVKNIEWITLGVKEIGDKLLREASLPSSSIDVGFLLNTVLSPKITELFEPLDDYLAKAPIEELEDFFPGLKNATKIGGKTYAIPFRHATNVMHYNEELLAEVGIGGPPQSMDDFIEFIPKLRYQRSDGTQVYGFVYPGKRMQTHTVTLSRGWDGDYITTDYKCTANGYGMLKAVTELTRLYEGGFYPKAFPTLANTDTDLWVKQGRAALYFSTGGRTHGFNNPDQSKFPGKIKIAPVPISKELSNKYKVAPTTFEFWCLAIPKNAQNKDFSWDFIRYISSKNNTLRAALNGNGPVRQSTYENQKLRDKVSYWESELAGLNVGRVPVPGFENSGKADDLINEYVQSALLGRMTPKEAMDKLTEEVNKLLP